MSNNDGKIFTYQTKGTCSTEISFSIDAEGKMRSIVFTNGCSGNTKGVAKLAEGRDAAWVRDTLIDTPCGSRGTSCPDQLARAIDKALS